MTRKRLREPPRRPWWQTDSTEDAVYINGHLCPVHDDDLFPWWDELSPEDKLIYQLAEDPDYRRLA